MTNSEIIMDKRTELVWQAFKLYLPPGTQLKDVIRPPMAQLELIVRYSKKEGFHFAKAPSFHDRSTWEPALQYLKNKGYKIAAPGTSQHSKGYAFDLAGPDLNRIKQALLKADSEKAIHLMPARRNWPNPNIEDTNRCVHVEIDAARIDFEPFDFA